MKYKGYSPKDLVKLIFSELIHKSPDTIDMLAHGSSLGERGDQAQQKATADERMHVKGECNRR